MPPLRFALRSLAKSPLFAAVAVLSLGLALALNTTMFALVDAVLEPPLPYREPGRVFEVNIGGGARGRPVGAQERVEAVRAGMRSAAAHATYLRWLAAVQAGPLAEDQIVAAVSPGFVDLLGVRPAAGRALGPADASAPVALISYRLWRARLGGRPVGELSIGVGTRTYSVVGVMPRGMHFPDDADVWVPLDDAPRDSTGVRGRLVPVVRIKPGVTRLAAEREAAFVAQRLTAELATPDRPVRARLYSLEQIGARPERLEAFHYVIIGAVVVVLLVACANLATMLLARGAAREREIAVRMALGAGRGAIVQHVLTECALLAGGGGALGLLLTTWAMSLIASVAPPYVPELGDVAATPSWRVFVFSLGISLLTVLLAGLIPAVRAAAVDPAEPMKEGSGATTGRLRDRHSKLVMTEMALSTALLMGAAVVVLGALEATDYRFRKDLRRLVSTELDLQWQGDPFTGLSRAKATGAEVARRYDVLVERAARLPGAEAAATVREETPDHSAVTGERGRAGVLWINNYGIHVVSPDFLRTFGVQVVEGRDFEAGDRGDTTAAGVAIVDENAVVRLWPNERTAVGHMIKLGDPASPRPWLRVVGVARATEAGPRDDDALPPAPAIYVVYPRDTTPVRRLVVRATTEQTSRSTIAGAVRQEVLTVSPTLGWVRVQPWLAGHDARVATSLFLASLFGAFGAFALSLTAVGLYGVLAYAVTRRRREFAVRLALGARGGDIVRIVVHDSAVVALAGVGVGAFVALAATRPLMDTLHRTHLAELKALLGAEAVLFLVAALASLAPVRRAVNADPAEVLRST